LRIIDSLSPIEKQLFALICDILDTLQRVLPLYAHQVAEQVFKAQFQVSTTLEKRQVKRFQQELRTRAEQETARILMTLSDERLWILPPSRHNRESLHHNKKVWTLIQSLIEPINALLIDYGYHAQHGPTGLFFPETQLETLNQLPEADTLQLLSIKYWMLLARQRQESQVSQQQKNMDTSQHLDALWND
jgi:hypothetical protein